MAAAGGLDEGAGSAPVGMLQLRWGIQPIRIDLKTDLDAVLASCVWSAANEKTSGSLNPVRQDSQNSFTLLSGMPTMVAKVGHSRVPPITAGQHFQVSLVLL